MEAASEVVTGVAVEQIGLNVWVKSGDSRSNCSSDMRAAHFVVDDECNYVDERSTKYAAHGNKRKRHLAFRLRTQCRIDL